MKDSWWHEASSYDRVHETWLWQLFGLTLSARAVETGALQFIRLTTQQALHKRKREPRNLPQHRRKKGKRQGQGRGDGFGKYLD